MNINISFNGKVPIYRQIQREIISHILCGSHTDSMELPSIRELSRELKISVITVKKAYYELQSKNIIYTIKGKGTYLNPNAKEIITMDNYNNIADVNDYGLSFSDEYSSINEKIKAVFADTEKDDIRAFAANVIIGNTPAKKLSENVGSVFELCGFHIKDIRFKDDRTGRYILMFGRNNNGLCSYGTSSDKVYSALMAIVAAYGDPAKWKQAINVRIRMNNIDDNGGKAYSLEVIG